MNFTAEEVRKAAAWLHQWERKSGARNARAMLTAYADAIDAHIAGMGEPVATICDGWDLRFVGSAPIAEVVRKHGLKIGDTLYIAPPIDVATVRGVIAELQCIGSTGVGKESEASLLEYINDAADRLEAAIKRAARKSHG